MNHKMNFEGVYFKGTFRDYQQRVLDNSKKYLFINYSYSVNHQNKEYVK